MVLHPTTGFILLFATWAYFCSHVLSASPLPPSQDPFYQPPSDYEQQRAGAILRSRRLEGINATLPVKEAYQLLYRSTDSLGHASASVTTVLIPFFADFSKHLAYHTAYDTADGDCSPSYAFYPGTTSNGTNIATEVELLFPVPLLRGIPISTSDYEGEHAAFTAGPQAAYGALDSIKAVLASQNITGISPSAKTVMFGYSGGSIATEWASEYAASYAPELDIAAAAFGGLSVNSTTILGRIDGGPDSSLIPASLAGLAAAYPDFADFLNASLIPGKADEFDYVRHVCQSAPNGGYSAAFANRKILDEFLVQGRQFLSTPEWQDLVQKAGRMGLHATPKDFALYIYKATTDEVVPTIEETDELVRKFCDDGATVRYFRYLNGTHDSAAVQGSPPALQFLLGILDGIKPAPGCTTIDVPSIPH